LRAGSLITLDTPHKGSVLAEYGVEARQLNIFQLRTNDVNVELAKLFEGSYYCDLTPVRATAYVASTVLPNGVQTASVASNADCNSNDKIESGTVCSGSRTESTDFTGGDSVANPLYQLVGGTDTVTIAITPRKFHGIPLPDQITVKETRTTSFQTN